ncbi:chorismate-binding protein [Chryseobacterium gossypii]|uniref:chorismate-binding protein n=1 Tax=Chryseobacterium gossypii TaxID=3231602 RepID=UPI003523DFEA
MIYFKLPFSERIYTVNESSDKNSVIFHSFDGSEQITFNGDITAISEEEFRVANCKTTELPEDKSGFIAETKDEYLHKLEEVIEFIKANRLPKLVLSRKKILRDFGTIDLNESFINLCKTYPNAFRYLFTKGESSWMGAFSEVLGKFNKATGQFETMSLAGTLPVSENWTEKEIEEQKPVTTYIQDILKNYSDDVEASQIYDHISGNIKHLRTDFKARIRPEDLDKIIHELHPTPAVCGIPKDLCKESIRRFEKFPRELYAGYIRIETEEAILYFVNLRCAKLYRDSVHIFAGGGITGLSNPEKEWTETELKSEAILKNLVS